MNKLQQAIKETVLQSLSAFGWIVGDLYGYESDEYIDIMSAIERINEIKL